MSTLNDLTIERKQLIMHRITRAVYEKLQREDVMAVLAFCFTEINVHVPHNARLDPAVLKENYVLNTNMLKVLLESIQRRCKFEWSTIVSEILKEEGVTAPESMDELLVTLAFIKRVAIL